MRYRPPAAKRERTAADYWDDPGLVFTSSIGTRLDRRNVLRWWHDLTVRSGVGRRRLQASRHTAKSKRTYPGTSTTPELRRR